MPMNIRERKLIHDWYSAELRMAQHKPRRDPEFYKTLVHGAIAIMLYIVLVFFLYQILSPTGSAFIYGVLK